MEFSASSYWTTLPGKRGIRQMSDRENRWKKKERIKTVIHVNPRLIHVSVWQKPVQYCKVISLQLIQINGKKRKKRGWVK